jgi:FAD dependent oxidoreductase TIGR03364
MARTADLAVVGAGIVGLSHAYHAARSGAKVVVFERDSRPLGASIRNFGMVWPIGQPEGPLHDLALRSRGLWLELAAVAGFSCRESGSLHLAYLPEELGVLEEFVAGDRHGRVLIQPEDAVARAPAVRREGLLGALWSPTELAVDPGEAIPAVVEYLAGLPNVELKFGVAVKDVWLPRVRLADGSEWRVPAVIVATGAAADGPYSEMGWGRQMELCKLQMLRSRRMTSVRIGPHLAGGLTMVHYRAFRETAPAAVSKLEKRHRRGSTDYLSWGIHVMATQLPGGELLIGDTHEYSNRIDPFHRQEPDELILDYLQRFLDLPSIRIQQRWHGVYGTWRGDGPALQLSPEPEARIVSGVGGAGMTLALGIAEDVWKELSNGG